MNRLQVILQFVASSFTATMAAAGGYNVSWHTIDNGGGTSADATFSVSGTVAQPDVAAPMSGAGFAVQGGFWPGGPVFQRPCDHWTAFDTGVDNGAIYDFATYNGDLYAAGYFTAIGGQIVNQVARWTGAYWTPLGAGTNGGVVALTVYNNQLIAGGAFTTAGNQTASNIAQWDGSSWQPISAGLPGPVADLIVHNGQLIACGAFYPGPVNNGAARWTGSTWEPMAGVNLSAWQINAFAIYNNDLIAAGYFRMNDGSSPWFYVARWTGVTWAQLGVLPGEFPGTRLYALTVHDDDLFAGGSVDVVNSGDFPPLARWNGSVWQLDNGLRGEVRSLTQYNDQLIAGGFLSHDISTGLPPYGIARRTGSQWQPLGDGLNPFVRALIVQNDELIAGGEFAQPDVPFNRVARWRDCGPPPCAPDITGDQQVNIDDLLTVVNSWGPCVGCPADTNGDGFINIDDLLTVINGWGSCL